MPTCAAQHRLQCERCSRCTPAGGDYDRWCSRRTSTTQYQPTADGMSLFTRRPSCCDYRRVQQTVLLRNACDTFPTMAPPTSPHVISCCATAGRHYRPPVFTVGHCALAQPPA